MNQICEIADSNLILTNAKTGLNNFSMNEAFAKKLDSLSKNVTGLAKTIQDKAEALRAKIDKAIDTKENLREIAYADRSAGLVQKMSTSQRSNEN